MKHLLTGMTSGKSKEVQIKRIDVNKIYPDPKQPRTKCEGLKELADTIIKHGLQNPIHVRPGDEGNYVIISGERRWLACKEYTDLEVIPCVIHSEKLDEKELRYLQLIENIQRQELTPLDEAKAYKSLLDSDLRMTQTELAGEIGVDKAVISNIIRLLSLPEVIQQEIGDHSDLSKSLLLELSREKDVTAQILMWEKIKKGEFKSRSQVRLDRQVRLGMKKMDVKEMNSEEVWDLVKKAVRKDRDRIKELISPLQLQKLMDEFGDISLKGEAIAVPED